MTTTDSNDQDGKIEETLVSATEADPQAVALKGCSYIYDPGGKAGESSAALVVPVMSTSVTAPGIVTEVVTISTADLDNHIRATMGTCGQLVAERDRVTADLRRQAKDTLYPALIEMRKRYNNPGARTDLLPGIVTFEAYLESIGFCSSILRVWDHRQRQKELESLLPSDGRKRLGFGSSGRSTSEPTSPVATDADDAIAGDATSALVNLGYKHAGAKQAIGQALAADQGLATNLDGLLRAAMAILKPGPGNGNVDPVGPDATATPATAGEPEDTPAGETVTPATHEGYIFTGDEEPIPLDTLADRLLGIADELGCAWGLEEFACGIEAIAERMQDRDCLNKRMVALGTC